MQHDDARDPERRADDATPPDPTPTDPTPTESPDAAGTVDANEVPPHDAAPAQVPADAPAQVPSDAPISTDATLDATWPQQDVAPPADERADTWPERVEPEPDASAAWPAEDRSASDLADTASYDAVPAEPDYSASTTPAAPAGPPPSEAEAFDPGAAAPAAAAAAGAHAVPATNVSESTRCPRCGTENRPGLAFCSNCGQRLVAAGASATLERPGTPEGTQACPRCGTHNRAGVAFCQNCGANLRTAAAAAGYVPPAVTAEGDAPVATGTSARDMARGGAILGPIVLLIGAIGIAVGWLLPFPYGGGSLFERAFGSGGYGAAFWSGFSDVSGNLIDQVYFGLAGAAPVFVALLLVLVVAGLMRAVPGSLQRVGLGVAAIWALGLVVLFLIAEVFASWSGDIVGLLRDLSPGGIIFFLASLIVLIGTLTRFAKS
ncbi:MAG: zinc-ribbon domain-containing protein [Chloroflexota bacterium]